MKSALDRLRKTEYLPITMTFSILLITLTVLAIITTVYKEKNIDVSVSNELKNMTMMQGRAVNREINEEFAQLKEIRNLLVGGMTFLWLLFLFCSLLIAAQVRHQIKTKKYLEEMVDHYRKTFVKMGFSMILYDVQKKKFISDDNFEELFSSKHPGISEISLAGLSEEHPEISVEELKKDLTTAIEERRTVNFETVLLEEEKGRWIRITLIPMADIHGRVSLVVATLQDETEQHSQLEEALERGKSLPCGIMRMHFGIFGTVVEYFSDSFTIMTGYSRKELEQIFAQKAYDLSIPLEDREAYHRCISDREKNEGTSSCNYHFIKKDGEIITLCITIESRSDEFGLMHGYAVIMDISSFAEKTEQLEEELEKTRERLKESRIKISTSQIQPHFLYNALSSIREIVLENPQYASDLIYDFTVHLRACIRSMSSDALIPVTDEIKNIEAYVGIEQMRFGKKLNVEYDIRSTDFSVIPLGVQPIVENSIRHGIFERGARGGTVSIRTGESEKNWIIEVQDDGMGFDVGRTRNTIDRGQKDSTGLANLIYRFQEIMKASVEIESQVGTGTRVRILIPKGVLNESNCSR